MFELPIACGGCRARGKAGTMWAGDSHAREEQRSRLKEVAGAGTCCHAGSPAWPACALWPCPVTACEPACDRGA